MLNRQAWAEDRQRHEQPAPFWPHDGIVRRFNAAIAGWIALKYSAGRAPREQADTEKDEAIDNHTIMRKTRRKLKNKATGIYVEKETSHSKAIYK